MRIRKHIPNSITSLNLLCGVLGVICSLSGRLDIAFILMLGAAVFDFCDGLAARLFKEYSEIGKELDSLADDVSFGVLPAVMLYCISGNTFLRFVPMLIAAFSALRLAKFNIDERQHSSFIGLPTPASAMLCGSLASFVYSEPTSILAQWCSGPVLVPALTVILCFLMVSEIPMFAMKFGGGNKATDVDVRKRIAFALTVVIAAVFAVAAGLNWTAVPLVSFIGYILINLFFRLFHPVK